MEATWIQRKPGDKIPLVLNIRADTLKTGIGKDELIGEPCCVFILIAFPEIERGHVYRIVREMDEVKETPTVHVSESKPGDKKVEPGWFNISVMFRLSQIRPGFFKLLFGEGVSSGFGKTIEEHREQTVLIVSGCADLKVEEQTEFLEAINKGLEACVVLYNGEEKELLPIWQSDFLAVSREYPKLLEK